jgi:hypothetical protein
MYSCPKATAADISTPPVTTYHSAFLFSESTVSGSSDKRWMDSHFRRAVDAPFKKDWHVSIDVAVTIPDRVTMVDLMMPGNLVALDSA